MNCSAAEHFRNALGGETIAILLLSCFSATSIWLERALYGFLPVTFKPNILFGLRINASMNHLL
jgi:hypothetical protein